MIFRRLIFAVLGLFIAILPARAEQVKYPAQSDPAFLIQLSEGWSSRLDSDQNLIVSTPDGVSAFSLTVAAFSESEGTLDDLAAEAMAVAKTDLLLTKQPDVLGGIPGTAYFTTIKNSSGLQLTLKLFVVRLDDTTVATCGQIERVDISAARRNIDDAFVKNLRFTPRP